MKINYIIIKQFLSRFGGSGRDSSVSKLSASQAGDLGSNSGEGKDYQL